jgi:hypothetical protein
MVRAARVTCTVRNPYGFDAKSCVVRSAHYRVRGLCRSNSQAARMEERWHRVVCPSYPADAVDAPAKGPEACQQLAEYLPVELDQRRCYGSPRRSKPYFSIAAPN